MYRVGDLKHSVETTVMRAEIERRRQLKLAGLVAAFGNISVQYNLVSASIALDILLAPKDVDSNCNFNASNLSTPSPRVASVEPDWAAICLLGLPFAGAVIGQFWLGTLSDRIGRRLAMLTTLTFVLLGVVGSAASTTFVVSCVEALDGWQRTAFWAMLSVSRLLVGLGVGGIYPLSAAASLEAVIAEHKNKDNPTAVPSAVGRGFFWMSPGSVMPYLVTMLLQGSAASTLSTTTQFSVILGAGALPALLALWCTAVSPESSPFTELAKQRLCSRSSLGNGSPSDAVSPLKTLITTPKHRRHLIGTTITWFVFDISCYGTSILRPRILRSIFGPAETIMELCTQSLIIEGIGIASIALAIGNLYTLRLKGLLDWGFFAMMTAFGCFAACQTFAAEQTRVLFGCLIFATGTISWGVNLATYVNPAMLFPTEVRGTAHGLSAAAGKLGALVGIVMYRPIAAFAGLGAVLWAQLFFSTIGLLVARRCIPNGVEEVLLQGTATARGNSDETSPLMETLSPVTVASVVQQLSVQ